MTPEQLRALCGAMGWKAADLARFLPCAPMSAHRYLKGKRCVPPDAAKRLEERRAWFESLPPPPP